MKSIVFKGMPSIAQIFIKNVYNSDGHHGVNFHYLKANLKKNSIKIIIKPYL
jgi:hypothetical protein